MRFRWLEVTAVLAAIAFAAPPESQAQSYPQKPVRIIVPSAAGGPTDIGGRLLAEGLSRLSNQRFFVENRVSPGGVAGADLVAHSEPNGYTLLYANTGVLALNPATDEKLPYDPAAFTYIGFVSNSPQLLVANPKLPAKTLKEILDYARTNPGKLNFAAGGLGALPHLTYELLKLETGMKATLVNYKGNGPALVAVMSGEVDLLIDVVGPRVRSGEVRAVAVTGTSRHPDIPDVPTMAEAGLPALTSTSGSGLVGPQGTPKDIVKVLNGWLNELLKASEFQAKMNAIGLTPASGSPDEFASWASEQRRKWIRVVKESGIKLN